MTFPQTAVFIPPTMMPRRAPAGRPPGQSVTLLLFADKVKDRTRTSLGVPEGRTSAIVELSID